MTWKRWFYIWKVWLPAVVGAVRIAWWSLSDVLLWSSRLRRLAGRERRWADWWEADYVLARRLRGSDENWEYCTDAEPDDAYSLKWGTWDKLRAKEFPARELEHWLFLGELQDAGRVYELRARPVFAWRSAA